MSQKYLFKDVWFAQRRARQLRLLVCLVNIKHLTLQCWPNLLWGQFNKTLRVTVTTPDLIKKIRKYSHAWNSDWVARNVERLSEKWNYFGAKSGNDERALNDDNVPSTTVEIQRRFDSGTIQLVILQACKYFKQTFFWRDLLNKRLNIE